MKRLNDNRSILQKVRDGAAKVFAYFQSETKVDESDLAHLGARMLIIQMGELSKKLDLKYKAILGNDNIFSKFTNYRNFNAHADEVAPETIRKMLDKVKILDSTALELIEKTPHNSYDLTSFENFGRISSKENRARLVDATISRLKNDGIDAIPLPISSDIKDYSLAIAEITTHADLIEISTKHSAVSLQVTEDIIKWAEQTKRKMESLNPFEKEEEFLTACRLQSPDKFLKNFGAIHEFLKDQYPADQFTLGFFRKEFSKLKSYKTGEAQFRSELAGLSKGKFKKKDDILAFVSSPAYKTLKNVPELTKSNLSAFLEDRNTVFEEKKNDLTQNFILDWESVLKTKKRNFELEQLENDRKVFCESLYQKIEDFKQLRNLLSPFTNDVKRLWDMSSGIWKGLDLSIIQKYADILKNEKSILELSDLLGKLREAEKEFEIEKVLKSTVKQYYKIDYGQKSEMVGIHESNDISNAISSEIALLSNQETDILFYQKFADHKLLTFQYQHEYWEAVESEEEVEVKRVKRKNKGPFIICVDTSSSMIGTPENIAKILCFSLVKIALRENRKCFLISFSTKIETIDLTDISNSMDRMVHFLSMQFNGGTDASIALVECLNLLKTKDYENADVIFISDFEIGVLGKDLIKEIDLQKNKGTKFNSLIVSQNVTTPLMTIFDNNWIYNSAQDGAIIKLVKDISVLN